MKLYAPKYYKAFKCIADKCTHSCCVGWEICIDGDTAERYKSLDFGYGREIQSSITEVDGAPIFALSADGRCPHLDRCGLCKIITELSEDYLCDICREHPRFYNETIKGAEVGIGMVCEEACRIILASSDYSELVEVGEYASGEDACEFDAISPREKIFSILQDKSTSYVERLNKISDVFDISISAYSDEYMREVISSLEYLNESNKSRFLVYSSGYTRCDYEELLERAFAYFVFRHTSSAISEGDFRSSLGLCLFCERLLASILENEKPKKEERILDIFRTVSEEIEYSEENTDTIKLEFSF